MKISVSHENMFDVDFDQRYVLWINNEPNTIVESGTSRETNNELFACMHLIGINNL